MAHHNHDDDDDDEEDDLSIAEAVRHFLEYRVVSVARATYERDRRSLSALEVFLQIKGWTLMAENDDSIDPEAMLGLFTEEVTYLAGLMFLKPFLAFCEHTPLLKTPARIAGVRVTMRQWVAWLDRNALLEEEEYSYAMDCLKS